MNARELDTAAAVLERSRRRAVHLLCASATLAVLALAAAPVWPAFAVPARVEPTIAVACRRLLTRPVESPLYNPNLPEEDLRALLLRIRAGISGGQTG